MCLLHNTLLCPEIGCPHSAVSPYAAQYFLPVTLQQTPTMCPRAILSRYSTWIPFGSPHAVVRATVSPTLMLLQGWVGCNQTPVMFTFAAEAAAFGIPSDRTQHLAWRLQDGEVDALSPAVTVLLIGTNNLHDNATAPEVLQSSYRHPILIPCQFPSPIPHPCPSPIPIATPIFIWFSCLPHSNPHLPRKPQCYGPAV